MDKAVNEPCELLDEWFDEIDAEVEQYIQDLVRQVEAEHEED